MCRHGTAHDLEKERAERGFRRQGSGSRYHRGPPEHVSGVARRNLHARLEHGSFYNTKDWHNFAVCYGPARRPLLDGSIRNTLDYWKRLSLGVPSTIRNAIRPSLWNFSTLFSRH